MLWLTSVLFSAIPISLAIGGFFAGRQPSKNPGLVLLGLAQALVVVYLLAVASFWLLPQLSQSLNLVSLSFLSMVMTGLVLFMTVILAAFSRQYLAGEARVGFYWRWLFNTLAAVALVVISNHLFLFLLGWVGISLALHKLLTFYPDRPRAVLAAHKKFLLARTAEALLFVAFTLLYQQHGTFAINDLISYFNSVAMSSSLQLSVADQIAAVLIAMTALIKCAQLPVHGWLMQVVEAPTPVSALLHAGVINLGGFLLILFAPLFIQVAVAQWLVLIVAGLTTVVAALIMSTRISIKVRLAWSTSAQMGLMLLECALGLYEVALLHLLTHSAYKAHAFLNAGNAVYDDMHRRLAPARHPSLLDWLLAASLSTILVTATMFSLGYSGALSAWILFALALTMLIAQRNSNRVQGSLWYLVGLTGILLLSYSLLKSTLGLWLPISEGLHVAMFSAADLWAIVLFVSLFLVSWLLRYQADRPLMQRFSIALFAGFYLDEWLTRLTIKLLPVRMPVRHKLNAPTLAQLHKAEEY